ncbi:hypothetical protein ZWY2020_035090 [Hordeum vulgare]|nr:hypothetical protein ZWY2020_035090 [Hordeum vulgare]
MEPPPASFVAPAAPPASSLPPPVAPPPQLRPPASSVAPAPRPRPRSLRPHRSSPHPAPAIASVAPVTAAPKLLINEKKKEVKLAQVEARHEGAKRKADLEERMIKIKEAKAWKELMVEEKEHMMMSKKDMDEDQLMWWKEYKEDIMERKRIFHD